MRVSRNELKSLLRQALEGAGMVACDTVASSEQLLCAAQHGLLNWSDFSALLSRLSVAAERPRFPDHQLPGRDMESVQLGGASLGFVGTALTDKAITQALNGGFSACCLDDCRDPELLFSKLLEAAELGLSGAAFWREEAVDEASTRIWRIGDDAGQIDEYGAPADDRIGVNSLLLLLSGSSSSFEQYLLEYWPQFIKDGAHCRLQCSGQQFESRYKDSIDNGILLPAEIWQLLADQAAKTLVPSDEQSRKGAGE